MSHSKRECTVQQIPTQVFEFQDRWNTKRPLKKYSFHLDQWPTGGDEKPFLYKGPQTVACFIRILIFPYKRLKNKLSIKKRLSGVYRHSYLMRVSGKWNFRSLFVQSNHLTVDHCNSLNRTSSGTRMSLCRRGNSSKEREEKNARGKKEW